MTVDGNTNTLYAMDGSINGPYKTTDYTGATLGRFKLDGQYKLAVLKKDDPEKLRELLRRLEAADELRQQAKEKLRQHEEREHATSLNAR